MLSKSLQQELPQHHHPCLNHTCTSQVCTVLSPRLTPPNPTHIPGAPERSPLRTVLAPLGKTRRGILKPTVIAMDTRMNVLAQAWGAEGQFQHSGEGTLGRQGAHLWRIRALFCLGLVWSGDISGALLSLHIGGACYSFEEKSPFPKGNQP